MNGNKRYRVVKAVTKNGHYYKAGEIVDVGESFGSSMVRLRFFKVAPKPKTTTTAGKRAGRKVRADK